ncbi:MAG: phosphatidate cytidylyltransferase [Succinivibrionaceae bacterium]
MKQRIITGVVLLLVALLWLFFPIKGTDNSLPLVFFEGGCLFVLAVASYEFSQFVLKSKEALKKIYYACIVCACYLLIIRCDILPIYDECITWVRPHKSFFNLNPLILAFFICDAILWLVAIVLILLYPKSAKLLSLQIVKAIIGMVILLTFVFALLILRTNSYSSDIYRGSIILVSIMSLVWLTDSGAYFVGRAIGKHKMSAMVSPNKTVEGLIGGLVFGFIGYCIIAYFGGYGGYTQNITVLTITCLITIIISVFGDLFESLLKRESKIKDSGAIFPGHGGMLDRIDSLLAAIPIFIVSYAVLEKIIN